jgi:acetyl-CoA carboxylase biotin carboxyl carrier protein
MNLSQDDIIQILKYVKESSFDELHLETGDLKIVVRKHGTTTPLKEQKSVPQFNVNEGPLNKHEAAPPNAAENHNLANSASENEKKKTAEKTIHEQGLTPIKSPMLGTFYRCPNPGEPPFVDIESIVKEETAVCVIEVMKLFSTISAGIRGKIVDICAEDSQMVEYNQILFLVDPSME